jgi:hypothetical protein
LRIDNDAHLPTDSIDRHQDIISAAPHRACQGCKPGRAHDGHDLVRRQGRIGSAAVGITRAGVRSAGLAIAGTGIRSAGVAVTGAGIRSAGVAVTGVGIRRAGVAVVGAGID